MTAISALVTVFELSPSELFLQVVKKVDVRARCGRYTTITLTDSPGSKRFRSPGIGLVTSAAFKYYLLYGLKGSPLWVVSSAILTLMVATVLQGRRSGRVFKLGVNTSMSG